MSLKLERNFQQKYIVYLYKYIAINIKLLVLDIKFLHIISIIYSGR